VLFLDSVTIPIDVVHHRNRNVVCIQWQDGSHSTLPVPYLRAWCPCAACQGHGPVVRHRPGAHVQLLEMHEIGAYALALRFSDGHDSGIYSWEWLHRIALESPPQGPKRGDFVDGAFVDDHEREQSG